MLILLAGFFITSVIRIFTQGIQKGMTGDNAQKPGGAKAPDVSAGGELKKCEACGVYNAAGNSVTKVRDGVTLYYCTRECRGKAASAA